MTTWLETILSEIQSITDAEVDLAEPDTELGPEDHIVGILPADLRKFSALRAKYRERFGKLAAEILTLPAKNSLEREEKIREAQLLDGQADIINDLFWMSCHIDFTELRHKESIGIRKGWKVVWREQQKADEILVAALERNLSKLFGTRPN